MKLSAILCLSFILSGRTFLTAQSTIPVREIDRERIRLTTYGGDSLDRALFILPTSNAFLVIGLTYESGVGNTQMLNVTHDIRVANTITHENSTFAFCFAGAPASDGNYLLTGFTSVEDKGLDSYVAMVDHAGNLRWTTHFGGEKHDRSYKCVRTRDNGFVIAGQTESENEHTITGQIYKINENGDLQWERLYGMTTLTRLYSVIEMDNGDLIVSGITNANYPDNSDILLYRLNYEGKKIWEKRHGGPMGDIAHSLVKGPGDTFLVVGYTAEISGEISDPQVLHFNAHGELVRQYVAASGADARLINGYLDDQGNYIGTGFVRKDLESDWDILFCKLHLETGKFDLYKTRISDQDEEAYHAAFIGKDKALIVGHTMGKGNGDIVLIEWKH